MINVLIPMAGQGSRFSKAGYKKPKPFIDVAGKPMIKRVLENLALPDARFVLIARQEHINAELELVKQLEYEYPIHFVSIDKLTEGTACTVLHARQYINNEDPLIIANSDQIVEFSFREYVLDCFERKLDGSILTFFDKEKNPKWSFAKINHTNHVTLVREKEVISDYATVGIYMFAKGKYFVESAIDMILAQDRVNGEYYTCPVYNYMIAQKKVVGIYNIDYNDMHGIGTPEDLDIYLAKYF